MAFSVSEVLSSKVNKNDNVYIQGTFRFTKQVRHVVDDSMFIKELLQRNAWYPRMLVSSYYGGKVIIDWRSGYIPFKDFNEKNIIYKSQDFIISNINNNYYVMLLD